MPQVTLDGRIIHYEDVGTGAPVLLLHGFPFTSESFWPQLEAPPAGCRLIVPDHRGFGRSSLGVGPSTMEAMADDALNLLDLLGLKQVVVGGVSMGGYVALALARLDPSRLRGLVLIDTQAGPDDAAGKEKREKVAKDVEANGVGTLVDDMLPKLLHPKTSPDVRTRLDALMRRATPAGVAAAARGMAERSDSKELLARYSGPCLVMSGDTDPIIPVQKAKEMAALVKDSQLDVIADAAHLPNLDQPKRFNEGLAKFVSTLKS